MSDPEKSAALYRNARREAVVAMVLFLVAMTWTVGYCYLRGYLHTPDQQIHEPLDGGPALAAYSNPVEGWLVRTGLAVPRSPDDLGIVLGMPDWIFWGVFVPWILCAVFTMLYASWGMSDDDLGPEAEGANDGH